MLIRETVPNNRKSIITTKRLSQHNAKKKDVRKNLTHLKVINAKNVTYTRAWHTGTKMLTIAVFQLKKRNHNKIMWIMRKSLIKGTRLKERQRSGMQRRWGTHRLGLVSCYSLIISRTSRTPIQWASKSQNLNRIIHN